MRDADRLQGFFARYHLHEDVENCTITENDALWESAVEVYNILGKQISAGGISKINGARLVDDIFAEWDTLWSEKAVYDVLAALAFRCEPNQAFHWFEGMQFLTGIEHDAMGQWCCTSGRKNKT